MRSKVEIESAVLYALVLIFSCGLILSCSTQAFDEKDAGGMGPTGPEVTIAKEEEGAVKPEEKKLPVEPPQSQQPSRLARTPSYIIQPGDTLQIKFLFHPYFNETIPVRPDGRISLSIIQDAPAAGLTPGQLKYYLEKKFSQKIENPDLAVIVKTFSTPAREQKVYIGGEVFIPKMIDLKRDMTLLQAIYEVGGFRDTANINSVIVIRNIASETEREVIPIDLEQVLAGNMADVRLRHTDVVYIPQTFIAKANTYVDKYLSKMVPRWVMTGFSFVKPIGDTTVNQVITAPQLPDSIPLPE